MLDNIVPTLNKNIVYLCPLMINRCHTGHRLPDDTEELAGMNKQEREAYWKSLWNELKYKVASYIFSCIKCICDNDVYLHPTA